MFTENSMNSKSACFFLIKLTLEAIFPLRQTRNYLISYGTVTHKNKFKSLCYVILSASRYQSKSIKIRQPPVQSQRHSCSMPKDRERYTDVRMGVSTRRFLSSWIRPCRYKYIITKTWRNLFALSSLLSKKSTTLNLDAASAFICVDW